MKITDIYIRNFHQFKDIHIDLTYPEGHPKAGEPLEKVCIIGQSGTGKTTLLKIVGGHAFTIADLFDEYDPKEFEDVFVSMKVSDLAFSVDVIREEASDIQDYYQFIHSKFDGKDIGFEDAIKYLEENLEAIKTHFIYFPADLKYEFESGNSNLSNKKVINFKHEKVGDIWNLVFNEIQKFQEEEIRLKQEIASVAVEKSSDIKAIQRSVRKLERWRKSSENPINRLADECLDPILKHLNLRVKREFKFESKNDLGIVKLEDLKGNEVPYHLLSTGTKQILLTALPLYLLKPDQTLILCDEPERSLYPTMQKFIIDYYTSLTKNSQFFFATHSPIIASSFEPWEIVELKFDEKGYIFQEKYYPEGAERHVDNYTIIPSYLTYDLMLSKVFDMDETHSHDRSEKITEVLMLRNQLLELKKIDQHKSAKAQKLYKKYRDLASKLFWDFELQ